MERSVLLGMPMRPGETVKNAASAAFYLFPSRAGMRLYRLPYASSVLPTTFDAIWSAALNHYARGEIQFAGMLHDDVCPMDPGWLDVLLDELEAHDADIVSAVVPLKDNSGLTSTALDVTGDVWNPRRLTLAEVFEQPETFTHPKILLNSGCWVADLRKPWATATDDKGVLACSFHQRNRIVCTPDGWRWEMRSEDWEFSRAVRKAGGLKQYATRKVRLFHEHAACTNAEVWGTCRTDPIHAPSPAPEPAEVAA